MRLLIYLFLSAFLALSVFSAGCSGATQDSGAEDSITEPELHLRYCQEINEKQWSRYEVRIQRERLFIAFITGADSVSFDGRLTEENRAVIKKLIGSGGNYVKAISDSLSNEFIKIGKGDNPEELPDSIFTALVEYFKEALPLIPEVNYTVKDSIPYLKGSFTFFNSEEKYSNQWKSINVHFGGSGEEYVYPSQSLRITRDSISCEVFLGEERSRELWDDEVEILDQLVNSINLNNKVYEFQNISDLTAVELIIDNKSVYVSTPRSRSNPYEDLINYIESISPWPIYKYGS